MTTQPAYSPPQHIVIADIDIPFWRLVVIFIKWTFAAIPAAIIVSIAMALIMMVVVGLFGGLIGLGRIH